MWRWFLERTIEDMFHCFWWKRFIQRKEKFQFLRIIFLYFEHSIWNQQKMQSVKDFAYTVSRLLQKIDVRYPNKDVMTS